MVCPELNAFHQFFTARVPVPQSEYNAAFPVKFPSSATATRTTHPLTYIEICPTVEELNQGVHKYSRTLVEVLYCLTESFPQYQESANAI